MENIRTPQEEFDRTYISSSEIGQSLGVCRATIVNAKRRGLLPNAIEVNNGQVCIWNRAEVDPYLDAWKLILKVRRRGLAE